MFSEAVIIGKFYPYHLGHRDLCYYALEHSHFVNILIVDRDIEGYEPIPVEVRKNWLNKDLESHIDRFRPYIVKPKLNFPSIDNERWALLTIQTLHLIPDAVFSHEYERDKGYAEAMLAAFVVPPFHPTIHATMIREEPAKYIDYLPPIVRDYYQRMLDEQR